MEHPELGAWVTLPPRLDFWAPPYVLLWLE